MGATVRNTFTGTDGADATVTNSGWDVVKTAGTIVLTNSIAGENGPLSARLTASNATGLCCFSKALSSVSLAADVVYTPEIAPSVAGVIVGLFGAVRNVSLDFNTNRTVTLRDKNSAALWTSTAVAPLTFKTRFAIHAVYDSSDNIGTVQAAIFSGAGTSTPMVGGYSGIISAPTGPDAYSAARVGTKSNTGAYTGQGVISSMAYDLTASGFTQPQGAPSADIGADVLDVEPGARITLDGTGSVDAGGPIANYVITQTAGPTVLLVPAGTGKWTFIAPATIAGTTLTFQLTVEDADSNTATDSMSVTVMAATRRTRIGGVPTALASRSN